ncbi:hypothetical protein ACNQGP_10095 [Flavobacterium sp. GT2N3]
MESTKLHFGSDFPVTTLYLFEDLITPIVQLATDGTGFFQEFNL